MLAALVSLAGVALVWVGWIIFEKNAKPVWHTDLNAARRESLASGRPLLIEFTASWCQPCNEMKARTLSDPGVIRELRRYVLVSIDVATNQRLAATMQVERIPTFLITDPKDGKVLKENRVGYVPRDTFLFWLSTDRK
jgi:thiol:disulfide interchange protein DsbD